MVETGVDVGPAIYLARVFNTEIDTVVKFFIFILVFVFDPLAVSLVIAANMAFELASKDEKDIYDEPKPKKRKGMKWWEFYKDKRSPTPDVEEEQEVIEEEPPVIATSSISGPEKGGIFPNKKN